MVNAYWESLDYELPTPDGGAENPWRRWIDTFLDAPNDIVEWQAVPSISDGSYRTEPRSVVVLFANVVPARGDSLDLRRRSPSALGRTDGRRVQRSSILAP